MASGTLPETIVWEHNPLCSPQLQVKAVLCTEAVCEHDPETQLPPLGQRSFNLNQILKFIMFGVLQIKEERDQLVGKAQLTLVCISDGVRFH